MKINYIGHSGFILESDTGERLGLDIWLDNPLNPQKISEIPKLDYLFCSHDHSDHGFTGMIEIAKRDDSQFIGLFELMNYVSDQGVAHVHSANFGGGFTIDDELSVFVTRAHHTSNLAAPSGLIAEFAGKTIYFAGDTSYFSDMKIYGDLFEIDLAFLPIGSVFTMGPREAVFAAKDLGAKKIVPMHYNTFDRIAQDATAFKADVETQLSSIEVKVMQPGAEISI